MHKHLLGLYCSVSIIVGCGGSDPVEPELDTAPADVAPVTCSVPTDCPNPLDLCIAGTCKPQTACTSDKQCTPLSMVCDKDKGACVQCLVDGDCPGALTTCKAQTCQDPGIACTTSKMCPEGQLCSKATGVCVFCEGDGDCDQNQYCLDTICKADVCSANEGTCIDAVTRKTCLPNGSGWTESKCGGDLSCIDGDCAKVICTPGAKQCAATEHGIVTCNGNGTAWGVAEFCPWDASCKDAVCMPHVCVPKSAKCDPQGGMITCAADGLSEAAVLCPATPERKATICVTKAGVAVCEAQLCVPGAAFCDGLKAMTCAADGLAASLVADCSVPASNGKAQLCLDGGCVSATCQTGDKMCADTATLATCNAAGNGYDKSPCGDKMACANAACVDTVCAAGQATCNGQKAVKCNESGTTLAVVEDCAATGKACVNGACASKVCTAGQAQCQGAAVGVCKPDGTGWTLTPCGANEVCTGAKCVAKVCEPGLVECLGKAVRACNGSGSAWVPVQDCATTNQTCLDGECVAPACTAGAVSCDGKKLMLCNAFGTAWVPGEDCGASGKVCIDGKCSAAVCAPGALKCEGNKVSTCNAGATAWVTGEDCAGAGKVCVEGKCAVSVCTAGALGCDGKKLTQCNATGTGWTPGEDCGASGKVCIEGKCSAALCAPGALKCEGNKVSTCNAGATAWVVGTDCAAGGKVCVEGKCAVCAPGTSTCVNGKAGVCKADGSGWSETSCDDGNSCTADSCEAAKGCLNEAAYEKTDCASGKWCVGGVCSAKCGAGAVAGVLGRYPFDGNTQDVSGNERHGVVVGESPSYVADRCTGKAIVGIGKHYVKLPDTPQMAATASQDLSVAFWARLAGPGDVGGLVAAKYKNYDASNSSFFVKVEPTAVSVAGTGANSIKAPISGATGWRHFAAVMPKGGGDTRLYLNGVLVGSGALAVPSTPGPHPVTIGTLSASDIERFIGALDDVQFYARQLTAEEIAWLAADLPSTCGNGVKEGSEECDDGNQTDTDACTNACKVSWKLVLEENFDDGQAQGWTTCHGCAGMGCPTVTGGYYFMKGDWNVVCAPVDVSGKAGLAFEYDIVFANAYEVGWWLQGHALVNLGAQLAGNLKVCSNDQGASYSKAPQLVLPVQGTKAHVRMEASFADSRYRVWADNVLVMDTGAGCVTSAPYALRVYAKAFTNANAQVDNFKAWTR
jgi:hypothetical protein